MEEVKKKRLMEVEDIVCNILSRLPVKSLMKCKLVCKYWRGLISTPGFIRLQLYKSKENPCYIAQPWILEGWKTHLMKFDGNIFEKLPFPGSERHYSWDVICSFNGLICWTHYSNRSSTGPSLDIYISNPATREVLSLPKAPHCMARIGVASGPRINEYKVYGFFESQYKHIECEVYSSMTKSWKSIGHVAQNSIISSKHASINGVVYWFMSSNIDGFTRSILAIDWEENLIRISLPREVMNEGLFFVDHCEGCLSLVSSDSDINSFDIWVLKDINESIWVKERRDIITNKKFRFILSIAARRNEMLFIPWKERCLVYGLDNETWTELNLLDICRGAFAFTESLLPCGGFTD